MQLYAFDQQRRPIFAAHANKHQNYICPECQSSVRRRGGQQRRDHFFHTDPERLCRQNGKSGEHLAVQVYIHDRLPPGDCQLEYPFKSINRIADAVWVSKKIVFEVQCSFISAQEVKARNRDYAKMGYQVVWILHDARFNTYRLSAAEYWLLDQPHYFTNMQTTGRGMIYDQYSLITDRGLRKRLSPLEVDLSGLVLMEKNSPKEPFIKQIEHRFKTRSCYFQGDLIDRFFNPDPATIKYLTAAKNLEVSQLQPPKKPTWNVFFCNLFHRYFSRPYFLALQLLLERCSK